MSADDSGGPAREQAQVPPDVASLADYVTRLRADTEANFQTAGAMLQAQNQQLLKALQIQRRWNYGLTAALVVTAIIAVAALVRG